MTTLTGWTPDATDAANRAALAETTPILDALLSELPDPWPVLAEVKADIAARQAVTS